MTKPEDSTNVKSKIIEQVNFFKKIGLYPIPVKEDKHPLTRLSKTTGKYVWKSVDDWRDDEFIEAGGIGIDHEKSNIIDIDFDNENSIKFQHLLPETFGVGKSINEKTIQTHLFYHVEFRKKKRSFLSDIKQSDSIIVEILTNTQTLSGGHGRLVTNQVPIKKLNETEYENLLKDIGKIALLTMLSEYYPGEGQRDDYCLIVAGCLTKGNNWQTWEREDFLRELCIANGDTDELQSRINKICYQEEQRKIGKDVYGIPSFSKKIDVDKSICANWFDWIGNQNEDAITPITALSVREFVNKKYPPATYWIHPLVSKQTATQIWAAPGVGKTLFSMELACCLANGQDFLKYKWTENIKPVPVLYVEGEMSARQIQERICNITERYREDGKEFNYDHLNIATIEEQTNQVFDPLNHEKGRKRIEMTLIKMKEKFNEHPVLFLDNVSCLTNFQEKDGEAWNTFMLWIIKLRSQGYTIFFLHHATKEGSTSSGSNMKERSVDLEIKLSVPEKDQKLEINETQMVVEFKKWREFNFTEHSKPFLATVSRHTAKWSCHDLKKKQNPKEESFNFWYNINNVKIWNENMKDHETYPISKAYFYKLKKIKEDEELKSLTKNKIFF
tara:strand:- start:131 stop:1975 length:1845 start_codon:yes stop_codon:yes gene_type:complete